jgi:2-(1,2-epoxy-1,2-dihydrophenyl)acetyl-CoA isomerase
MSYDNVLFEVSEGIATITLNRPEALNALSKGLSDDFGSALNEVKSRIGDDINVLIITGAGRAFCAGGDIKAMNQQKRTATDQRARLRASQPQILDVLNIELPVISLVNGAAAGAGANLALAADFVFATSRAVFMQAFGRIGLVPDWGGFYVLPRLVGLQKAKELVFTARKVGAEEAQAMGMVHTVVSESDAMAETRAFAARLALGSTTAIGMAKTILNQSHNLDMRTLLEMEATAQGMCAGTDYHREAVRRFSAKEPALYDWEASADSGA